jgi:hypothetical protein
MSSSAVSLEVTVNEPTLYIKHGVFKTTRLQIDQLTKKKFLHEPDPEFAQGTMIQPIRCSR